MSAVKTRRRGIGRARNGVLGLEETRNPALMKAAPATTMDVDLARRTAAVLPIAGELCLLTTDRKLIVVKAKVLSHCDLGNAYAGRRMQPVPLGCVSNSTQMALLVDEESRLIEKLLTFLEIDADDASGQQLQARLTDSRGVLKRGLGPWLFPLLSAADRWGARHLRDLLVSAFVDNVDRVLQPVSARQINPFASLSGGVLKALLLPLLQRASADQLKTVLCLLKDCQQSVHSSNNSGGHGCGWSTYACRKETAGYSDCHNFHGEGLRESNGSHLANLGSCDKAKTARLRDRNAQDFVALKKVTDLIEDRLEELCGH